MTAYGHEVIREREQMKAQLKRARKVIAGLVEAWPVKCCKSDCRLPPIVMRSSWTLCDEHAKAFDPRPTDADTLCAQSVRAALAFLDEVKP